MALPRKGDRVQSGEDEDEDMAQDDADEGADEGTALPKWPLLAAKKVN